MKKSRSLVLPPPRRSRWQWLALLGLFLTAATASFGLYHLTADTGSNAPNSQTLKGMVWVPGGAFWLGSEEAMGIDRMPNSVPVHRVVVDGFWMDETEVTNAQFRAFVNATGYQTVAERMPDPELLAKARPDRRVKGPFSLVFSPPQSCPPAQDCNCDQWWKIVEGACWKHPEGPGSSIEGKDNYPVVHVCHEDAAAYAEWAGRRLPTEAEWERAARGGLDRKRYYWGDELRPGGKWMANTWQGKFPCENSGADGHTGLAPVKSYPPNGYGLYDMAGNVWEWCSDWYQPTFDAVPGEEVRNPTGPSTWYDPHGRGELMRVLRGGSYLCADEYCARYRAGGRQPGEISTGQSHTGFRCVLTPGEKKR